MRNFTDNHSDSIYAALGAMVAIPPILLVIAAGSMPEGLERGQFIVHGCGVILAVLATGLALLGAYALGFSKALKMAASAESSHPAIAWVGTLRS